MGDVIRKSFLWAGIVAFAFAVVWIALTAPETVAAQLGPDGEVNRREPKPRFLLAMSLLAAGMLALLLGLKWLVGVVPPGLVNLPGRRAHAYWTAPTNRPEFNRRIRADLDMILGATFVLMALATVDVTAVRGAGDSPAAGGIPATMISTAVFAALVMGYCVFMVVGPRYRVPR